jgi:hypothetical protein
MAVSNTNKVATSRLSLPRLSEDKEAVTINLTETLREHLETNERVIQEHSKRSTIEITKEFKDLLEAAEAQVRDRDEDSSRILADALMTFYKKSKVDF